MMDWARKKSVQLAIPTIICIVLLIVSAGNVYLLWQGGNISFGVDYRYQPSNSGAMVGLLLFSLFYLGLLVRKLISERRGGGRRKGKEKTHVPGSKRWTPRRPAPWD
jgi:hypothetical protein